MCTYEEWKTMSLIEKLSVLVVAFLLSILVSLPGWAWVEMFLRFIQ
ncbi:hypothetical protein [Vibrio bivalvicida]|uniref:Uncharacterized protein n=1 Tax=Vibrio bivalvicida TaxID=1276888 RepID=A0ABV4MLG5_9VIBR